MAGTNNFPSFNPIWKKYAHIKDPSDYVIRTALKEYSEKIYKLRPGLVASGWAHDYDVDEKVAEVLSQTANLTKPARINFITSFYELGRFLESDDVRCVRHEHSGSDLVSDISFSRPTAETPIAKEIGAIFDSITERRKRNRSWEVITPIEKLAEPRFSLEQLLSDEWLRYIPLGSALNDYESLISGQWIDWNVFQEFRWMFPFVGRDYQPPKKSIKDFLMVLGIRNQSKT